MATRDHQQQQQQPSLESSLTSLDWLLLTTAPDRRRQKQRQGDQTEGQGDTTREQEAPTDSPGADQTGLVKDPGGKSILDPEGLAVVGLPSLQNQNSAMPAMNMHTFHLARSQEELFAMIQQMKQQATLANGRPNISYAHLIATAIQASSRKRLSLKEIYTWITVHFPYYQSANPTWKNCVRHNLSTGKLFAKVQRLPGDSGKGCLWKINEDGLQLKRKLPYKQQDAMDVESAPASSSYSSSQSQSPVIYGMDNKRAHPSLLYPIHTSTMDTRGSANHVHGNVSKESPGSLSVVSSVSPTSEAPPQSAGNGPDLNATQTLFTILQQFPSPQTSTAMHSLSLSDQHQHSSAQTQSEASHPNNVAVLMDQSINLPLLADISRLPTNHHVDQQQPPLHIPSHAHRTVLTHHHDHAAPHMQAPPHISTTSSFQGLEAPPSAFLPDFSLGISGNFSGLSNVFGLSHNHHNMNLGDSLVGGALASGAGGNTGGAMESNAPTNAILIQQSSRNMAHEAVGAMKKPRTDRSMDLHSAPIASATSGSTATRPLSSNMPNNSICTTATHSRPPSSSSGVTAASEHGLPLETKGAQASASSLSSSARITVPAHLAEDDEEEEEFDYTKLI